MSHRFSVVWAAEISLVSLNNGIAGAGAVEQSFNQSVWDRWSAMSRADQAAGFLDAGERLLSTVEGLDRKARTDIRIQSSLIPFPVDLGLLTGMRLYEAVMHAWDVRAAFDPGATLPADEAAVLLEQFIGPLGFFVGFTGKPAVLEDVRPTCVLTPRLRPPAFGWSSVRRSASMAQSTTPTACCRDLPRRSFACLPSCARSFPASERARLGGACLGRPTD